MISHKRFDIFPSVTGGCSEGLDAFRFFGEQLSRCAVLTRYVYFTMPALDLNSVHLDTKIYLV